VIGGDLGGFPNGRRLADDVTDIELRFFFRAEDGIRVGHVTGVQTCALPICSRRDRDRAPFAPERQRDLTADTAAAAGDEGDLSLRPARHGLSMQNRKNSGRPVTEASSRDGSDRQRTRGEPPRDSRLDGAAAQPASTVAEMSSAIARRAHFMRPFYRGIGYI